MIPLLLAALVGCGPTRTTPDVWEVYALDYGRSTFKRSKLVQGAKEGPREPFAWMAWLIVGPEHKILVDTGFSDTALAEEWKIQGHRLIPDLLADLEQGPETITDVVITHAHWDHMGNVGAFPQSRVWIQEVEHTWATGRVSDAVPEKNGVRLADLKAVDGGSRLQKVKGDGEVAPGIRLHAGGGHTPGVQWVEIDDGPRTLVLASDIAYLYENIERSIPPGGSRDPAADATQIDAMKAVASEVRLVIPGHDPAVFTRFVAVKPGVVRLR